MAKHVKYYRQNSMHHLVFVAINSTHCVQFQNLLTYVAHELPIQSLGLTRIHYLRKFVNCLQIFTINKFICSVLACNMHCIVLLRITTKACQRIDDLIKQKMVQIKAYQLFIIYFVIMMMTNSGLIFPCLKSMILPW